MKRIVSILLAVMLIVAVMPASAFAASTKTVYVSRNDSDSRIYFRSGAGYDYSAKGVVYHLDKVTVQSTSGGWSKIKITSSKGGYKGYTGWIRTYYVDGTTKKLCTGSREVKSSTKLYASASTGSKVRGSLSKGETVKVYYFEHDFAKVIVNSTGAYGWVKMSVIGGEVDPTPVDPTDSAWRVYHTTASSLNVRTGPGTSYKVRESVKRNTACYVLESSGNWRRIKTFRGLTGWVSATYLSKNGTVKVSTNGGRLNVRSKPSTSGSVLGSLKNGSSVTATHVSGNWAYITSGSLKGWASIGYLR